MSRIVLFAVGTLAIFAAGNTAQAGNLNSVGRYLGLGWGDGYHAYNGCSTNESRWGHGANAGKPYFSPALPTTETIVTPAAPVAAPVSRPSPVGSSRRTAPIPPSQRMSQNPVYWYK